MPETKTIPIDFRNIDFTERVPLYARRHDKLEVLKQYYLHYICEDCIDGNEFDCDILDAINNLQKKYEHREGL